MKLIIKQPFLAFPYTEVPLLAFCTETSAYSLRIGARSSVVGKALRYKTAGRGFDSRWCHWNFSVT
jgi:hypothetical protein